MFLWWHLRQLHSPNRETRAKACRALGHYGETAFEPLANILLSDEIVRMPAVEALRQIGGPKCREFWLQLKGECDDYLLRSHAVAALGDYREPDLILPSLRDPEAQVRRATLDALEKIRDSSLAPMLAELLGDQTAVGERCVEVMVSLGNKAAVPALAAALQHMSYPTMRAATRALARLEWNPTTAMEKAWFAVREDAFLFRGWLARNESLSMDEKVTFLCIMLCVPGAVQNWAFNEGLSLRSSGFGETGTSQLVKLLSHANPKARHCAALLIDGAEAPEAIPALLENLKHEDENVCSSAIKTLPTDGSNPRIIQGLSGVLNQRSTWLASEAAIKLMAMNCIPQEPRDRACVLVAAGQPLEAAKLGTVALEPLARWLNGIWLQDREGRRWKSGDAVALVEAVSYLAEVAEQTEPDLLRRCVEAVRSLPYNPYLGKARVDCYQRVLEGASRILNTEQLEWFARFPGLVFGYHLDLDDYDDNGYREQTLDGARVRILAQLELERRAV